VRNHLIQLKSITPNCHKVLFELEIINANAASSSTVFVVMSGDKKVRSTNSK
jgi:hypothetical protein